MDELRVEITPDSLRNLLGKTSQFDRTQKAALRRQIRSAAELSRAAVQAEARKPGRTRSPRPRSRGTRARIASSTRVQILAGNSRAGVQIVTRAPLARAWAARRGWRHPVFGDRETWQTQVGNPNYFAGPIWARRNQTRRAVERAMEETIRSMGGAPR